MQVPLLDLRPQHDALKDDLRAALDRVLATQRFVLGDEGRALEAEIARYSNVKHAVGCASGTDALLLAFMALGVGAGDEVVTTPFSFFATASGISRTGARPVFADIEPRTYNIDPAKLEAAITPRTKVLMPVHLYGQPAEMDPLRIEQVLTNLLDNASKFSPPGTAIEVRLVEDGDALECAVRDHGVGIPEEHRKGIFARYHQAHAQSHESGLGLGLYVSRQIVELHQGSIRVEFPADGGTRFVVRLPRA